MTPLHPAQRQAVHGTHHLTIVLTAATCVPGELGGDEPGEGGEGELPIGEDIP